MRCGPTRRLLRLGRKIREAPEPILPKLSRYIIEGATVEAISEVLRDDDDAKHYAPAGKVLARHGEMSEFFGNLDRYTGGKGGGDRGAYLRLYDGGRYTVDRIGRGAFVVPNWSACILGGIQPGPIQRIAKDAAEDGLLQRFMYSVPGADGVGVDRAPDAAAIERYETLIPNLAKLSRFDQRVTLDTRAHRRPRAHRRDGARVAGMAGYLAAAEGSLWKMARSVRQAVLALSSYQHRRLQNHHGCPRKHRAARQRLHDGYCAAPPAARRRGDVRDGGDRACAMDRRLYPRD